VVSGSHADQTAIYLGSERLRPDRRGGVSRSQGFGSMRVNAWVELVGRPLLQLYLIAVALTTASGWIALAWAPVRRRCCRRLPLLGRRARRVTASV
jgi:hypothetical protein